uniref:F-box associated beta-propeller type 1 domain-containing protein n=1 Tax=Brassica oleracea var. oleracea TaxID=109376 RepID=A0A0D3ABA1_BRAOL
MASGSSKQHIWSEGTSEAKREMVHLAQRSASEEILNRVPANSLSRFRSASKQSHALLKSWRFARKHSACTQKEEPLSIMLIDYKVFLVRINLHGLQHNDVSPSVKVAYHFNLNASPVAIDNVFHCDGLLLCTIKDNKTRGSESMVRGNQVGLT